MKSRSENAGWRKAHVLFAWLLCLTLAVTLIRSRRASIGDEQLFPRHPAELLLSREVGRLELTNVPHEADVIFRAYDVSDLLLESFAVRSRWYPEGRGGAGGYRANTRTMSQIEQEGYRAAVQDLHEILEGVGCWQNNSGQELRGVDFWRGWMFVRDDEATHAKIGYIVRAKYHIGFMRHIG